MIIDPNTVFCFKLSFDKILNLVVLSCGVMMVMVSMVTICMVSMVISVVSMVMALIKNSIIKIRNHEQYENHTM